jgi:hypothetical protein
MSVFVVMSNHGIYHDCVGVFSSAEKAEDFLNSREIHKGYVKRVEVVGNYTPPNDLFEANSYLGEWKVHTFIGLYADPDEADAAAGKDGMVIPRSVDSD